MCTFADAVQAAKKPLAKRLESARAESRLGSSPLGSCTTLARKVNAREFMAVPLPPSSTFHL